MAFSGWTFSLRRGSEGRGHRAEARFYFGVAGLPYGRNKHLPRPAAADGNTDDFWAIQKTGVKLRLGNRRGVAGLCRLAWVDGPGALLFRPFGQPSVQLQPLLYAVQVVIRSAALLSEAVLAGLEDVQFGGQPRFSPRAKQIDRSLESDCSVIRRDRDE